MSVPAPSFDSYDSDDSVAITPSRPSTSRSPIKKSSPSHARVSSTQLSPSKVSMQTASNLSPHLQPFLEAQKRACLTALAKPPLLSSLSHDDDAVRADAVTFASIVNLLEGTIDRGEGNSCLVLGPRGSGKTRIVRETISQLTLSRTSEGNKSSSSAQKSASPIVVWLSGYAHTNDKLAMKEIGRQLVLQTGSKDLGIPDDNDRDSEDEFETDKGSAGLAHLNSILPPASHLSSIVTTLSSLPRPTIIILDAFDLFMGHARQALLYCLLDTVQNCRAGEGRQGVAVIGITSRVDCLNMLEKRVKSRFSHRIIRCSPPSNISAYMTLARAVLKTPLTDAEAKLIQDSDEDVSETSLLSWRTAWDRSIDELLDTREAQRVFKETFELVRDIGLLCRILTPALLELTPTSPWITPANFVSSARQQRAPDRFPFLSEFSYPCLSLMVAANHIHTGGHETLTFEHLFDTFSRATKQSSSVNVSLDGVSIGLQTLPREILFAAFEYLISIGIFKHSGTSSSSTARQFVRYRCEVDKKDIKAALDKKNHTQLKRWFSRAT
ncbi:hypothetical protein BS47DRAFT_855847 [Hydnum rufescens UP504]|uniref:Origin recognition complex subunit 4 n=1 Tax=Hydnum rufescens UP504 TaxID=1448309 RepID=A0A9P6DTU6_9AGAM|nr:hypothetical protein BS47DRAFT_855847 [Hydnum rufescens UP504]